MKKILLLPLDARPCNYEYTALMTQGTDVEILLPPKEILGWKKEFGDTDRIWEWVEQTAPECFGAIISIDTLVYSSILASRLHNLSTDTMKERFVKIKRLKEKNPSLRLFAFTLIMRNPQYSSSDEEPDYYENWGREIHRLGYISHKKELAIDKKEELFELSDIESRLPKEYLQDYLGRREKNLIINKLSIDYVKEGIIDFLIIPQDDSSPYGYTAKDQQVVRQYIRDTKTQLKVYMYPDADAVENTLAARLINEQNEKRPLVYPKYASALGNSIIPLYEDRLIHETIKYHILAAGGLVASCVSEADIVLMINSPSSNMLGHGTAEPIPHTIEYDANRNQIELVEYAFYAMETLQKEVCFADVAYANGGDPELFSLLKQRGIAFSIAGYAGWNTSSNTLGTCIPCSMIHAIYKDRPEHREFLALRYLEDIGYMAKVRREFCVEELEKHHWDYFHVDGIHGEAAALICERLQKFADEELSDDNYRVIIDECCQPWSRMFETGLKIHLEERRADLKG